MKCKQCMNTGIIVPVIGEDSSEKLKDWEGWETEECIMECDYCETVPNAKLYRKYMKEFVSDLKKKEKCITEKCPVCGVKLLLNGEGWGFCDNCSCEIIKG